MSIQKIVRAFVVVSVLSLALSGASWAEDPATKDQEEAAPVSAPPPAEADRDATHTDTHAPEPADVDSDETHRD